MNHGEIIRSKDNGRLVFARSVRDGREHDTIFIEGKRQCLEAVRSDIELELCLVSSDFNDRETIDAVSSRARSTAVVSESLFATVAETKSPQGIIVIANRPKGSAEQLTRSLTIALLPTIVFLSEINNPSNLGAILRTVEGAGAAGVITSVGSTDAFSPKANRAALGANLRCPIWERASPNEVLEFAVGNGLATVAAVVRDAVDHTTADWTQPTLLMLGSEAHGLTDELALSADTRVTIPLSNNVESLNLAVSTGILLFEAARQNRCK